MKDHPHRQAVVQQVLFYFEHQSATTYPRHPQGKLARDRQSQRLVEELLSGTPCQRTQSNPTPRKTDLPWRHIQKSARRIFLVEEESEDSA